MYVESIFTYLVGNHFSQDQFIIQMILWKSHTLWEVIFHRISPFSGGSCGNPIPCGRIIFHRISLFSWILWKSHTLWETIFHRISSFSWQMIFILPGRGVHFPQDPLGSFVVNAARPSPHSTSILFCPGTGRANSYTHFKI
jgi:hypothetical protein